MEPLLSDFYRTGAMHTPKLSISMVATLMLALFPLPLPTADAITAGSTNCSASCGPNYELSYPFGIGNECSLPLPGFNLTCVQNADNTTTLLLGNPAMVIDGTANNGFSSPYSAIGDPSEFNSPYSAIGDRARFSSPYPAIGASISYFFSMTPGVRDYIVHWEAPGRPFAISGSSSMSLFVVGCGVKASLLTGDDSNHEVGSCSVICAGDQFMDLLSDNEPCVGIGCCSIDITVNLRAFTLNVSRISGAERVLEQVNAFITDQYGFREWDLGADLTGKYKAMLSWAIPFQPDCEHAMEDRAGYACYNNSKCHDSPIGGYVCNCTGGFSGDPYVVNGCVVQVLDSMQPMANCPTSCGNVSVPFPFGIEVGCFSKVQLYLTCNPGLSLPFLQMSDGSVVTGISIDDGTINVLKPSNSSNAMADTETPLYAFSEEWGVVKWAVDSMTCKDAMSSEGYRCFSHSDCVDVTEDKTLKQVGYRCKCSHGFEGNPYLKDGCTDIDECLQPDKYICKGICQNTFGSYTCNGCPHGTDFNDMSRKCKPSTIILGVTVGLSSGGSILFLAAVVLVLTRRWKRNVQKRLRKRYFRKNKGILLEQLISSDQSASDGTKIFSLEELEKATNNFDHARVLGHGGHGTVFKGILTDQRVVAIKRSKLEESTEIEQFINEVSILSRINHRNVVKLHGCCLEAEVPLLVYEFVPNGTLYDLLHREKNGILLPLSWEERLRIAIEISGALTYLHSEASVSILHRDVKCMNILLNDSYTAKVSDFGASRSIPIDQTHLLTAVQGTFGYLDPEYYYTGQLNEKSDVYSFGVILLELLTRNKPIFVDENGEKQNLSNYFLWATSERPLKKVVDKQTLEEASEEAIVGTAQLAEECLSLTRGERPTMKEVEMRLQMLRTCQGVAPRARMDEVPRPRCESAKTNGIARSVPVAAGHNVSRHYSLEQEFVLSSRVPR